MQIIQSPLRNNVHPLGVRSSLSNPQTMLLRKESHFLHSQSNVISPIQTKPPLVTSYKFLLFRKHEPSIQPLIGWDTQDINGAFPLLEFDSFDSITPGENSSESIKDGIAEIMPTSIEKNTINDTPQKLNTKGKSKSIKTNKSQQPSEKKSKPKSKTKKTVKSAAAKNVAQFVHESNIPINRNEDSLLVSKEPLSVEAPLDIPKLQRDIASENTTSDNDSVSSITTSTSPSIEENSSLFRKIANDDLRLNSELPSSLASPKSEAITPKVSATSPEIAEAPKIRATPPEISETASAPKVNAASPETGETAIAPKVSATSPETSETVIAPKITSKSPETGETVIAPKVSATLPETGELPVVSAISPEISEVPVVSATPPEIGETAIALKVSTASPEIAETAIAPKVSATSPETGETAIAPKVSATSPKIGEVLVVSTASPETGETAIAPKVSTASPEIAETAIAPKVSTTSPEILEAPAVSTTSSETGETAITPKVSTASPEIGEVPKVSTASPEIGEVLVVSTTSPEIGEVPKVSATSSEISETAIAPKVTTTSPETVEVPVVSTTSPEIHETASIFKKTVDSEQTVESKFSFAVTNPEISTFVDTSDNPTSPQDQVSTPPEVEQNSLQTPNFKKSEEKTSPETPTKVDSFPDTSLQLKSAKPHSPQISNSLIPSSLGLDVGRQKLSILNSPQLNTLQNKTTDVSKPSSQYSSPTLIFRKLKLTNHTPSQQSDTPSQWSSVEELLNGNNEQFTSLQRSDTPSQWSSVEELLNGNNDQITNDGKSKKQKSSESSQVFAKHLPSAKGFAAGRKATPPDISRREIKPVTHTIKNTYLSSEDDKDDKVDLSCRGNHKGNHKSNNKGDTADFEALVREIYNRLRHRIEIERERHGHYSGRAPW